MHTHICVFGASITFGFNDKEKGGWVNRLQHYLADKDFDGEVFNLGISGDNTTGLLKRIENESAARKAGIIIISIGNNNSQFLIAEKKNRTPLDKFKKNIEKLIEKSKKVAGRVIFIGLAPVDESRTCPIPWATNKMYKNEYIELYNDEIKEICKKKKIKFIELFLEMVKLDYKKMLDDGLHPNARGHKWMTEQIIKELGLI